MPRCFFSYGYLSTYSVCFFFFFSNQLSTHEPKKDALITNPGKEFKTQKNYKTKPINGSIPRLQLTKMDLPLSRSKLPPP